MFEGYRRSKWDVRLLNPPKNKPGWSAAGTKAWKHYRRHRKRYTKLYERRDRHRAIIADLLARTGKPMVVLVGDSNPYAGVLHELAVMNQVPFERDHAADAFRYSAHIYAMPILRDPVLPLFQQKSIDAMLRREYDGD